MKLPKHSWVPLLILTVGIWTHVGPALWYYLKPTPVETASDQQVDFRNAGLVFVSKHCLCCHGPTVQESELALHVYKDELSILNHRDLWETILRRVISGEMPPPGQPVPSYNEKAAFNTAIRAILQKSEKDNSPNPGRMTIRRLNRVEYDHTIRDLVGVDFTPSEDFPEDDIGHDFDNIGEVLSLSPLLMERYLDASERIVQQAVIVDEIEPLDPRLVVHRRLLACSPDLPKNERTREILTRFASRAYRRPAGTDEVDRLLQLVERTEASGYKWEAGMQLAMQAVLVSPKFLFRLELDDRADCTSSYAIDDYELASRLSYFIWSSMPDDELFELAGKKVLAAQLEPQVLRMLADPKARSLVDHFAMQWLQLGRLKTVAPDVKTFPAFDEELRSAMLKETELFLKEIVREDRSIFDLIDSDFTFLNEPLARHYGIIDTNGNRAGQKPLRPAGKPIQGKQFQRVSLDGGERGGILTQASVLTVNSNPTRTSPVKRGRWVLEQIMGNPIPPPPPNVPDLDEKTILTGSLRQRMEQHRKNPSCVNCHSSMDPVGFAFENYDGIGGYREKDGDFPIDTSGKLPKGETFKGLDDLKSLLKENKEFLSRSLAEKMLTYALGRGVESHDRKTVDGIVAGLERNDFRISALVLEIAKSEPFGMRQGKDQR